MGYTLTQEEKLVLSELRKDLIKIKNNLIDLGIELLNYTLRVIRIFLLSLEEFKWQNIQKQGLGEILYQRALRFFKLEDPKEKIRKTRSRGGEHKKMSFKNVLIKLKREAKKGIGALLNSISNNKSRKRIAKNVYIDKYS